MIEKLIINKTYKTIDIEPDGVGHLVLKFNYNPSMISEIRSMEGAKWNPDGKFWTIKDSKRNQFQLDFLRGLNPYKRYDAPLIDIQPNRSLRQHQLPMFQFMYTRKQCIVAAEMGLGKSLCAIELMEHTFGDWWYVAPKSAIESFKYELIKWHSKVVPLIFTYEGLVKAIKQWEPGRKAPKGVIFDEASRCKNQTAQRSQATFNLSEGIRNDWGDKGYIIEMSGSPSPKSPLDWYSLAEIACPGYLKEGNIHKFRDRLGIIVQKEGIAGAYPELVTWRDSELKCHVCGRLAEEHSELDIFTGNSHKFVAGKNEITGLYNRLKGLVLVQFKRDCFSGSTEVLTKEGIFTFKELAIKGKATLYVNTFLHGMQWIECEIKSFGEQETNLVKFGNGNSLRTTKGHQWYIRHHKKSKYSLFSQYSIKRTDKIKIGKDQLPYINIQLPEINWEGYAHGFVFGDGHNVTSESTGKITSRVQLYNNDIDLIPLLVKFGNLGEMLRGKDWSSYIDVINSLPGQWKQMPDNPTKEYALGFILGLFSADGNFSKSTIYIHQADFNILEQVRLWSQWIGLRCGPIRLARIYSPFDNSVKPLWGLPIQTFNLTKEHFLRRDHKKQLMIRERNEYTTISSISKEVITEEVFCAIVPEYHNFTLGNGILTRNCLDLPEKQYREIIITPSPNILRAAKILEARARTTIEALTNLRELSDGFQYKDKIIGKEICPECKGEKVIEKFLDKENLPLLEPNEPEYKIHIESGRYYRGRHACDHCNGTGNIDTIERQTIEVESPKEEKLIDLLDEYSEIGRVVIYAGFTGSIDRIVRICHKYQWCSVRVDGRGWLVQKFNGDILQINGLTIFQDMINEYPNVAFIGHPGSAGMGITLTKSPMITYYSNTFNAEDRIQSEDRIHRMSMDTNLGATIIDLIHLPTDRLILDNLKKKRDLQAMSLGEIKGVLDDSNN